MRSIVVAAMTALVCPYALGRDAPKPPTADIEVPAVNAAEVTETFLTNEVRADTLYLAKEFAVTGKVGRVITPRRPLGDDMVYVVEMKVQESPDAVLCLQFYFGRGEREVLSGLRAGQEVTIRGRCGNPAVSTGDRKLKQKDYVEVPFLACKLVRVR
jgi:tRNA_anti-like